MQRFMLYMIELYRAAGGSKRWFGIECNFEPTCSMYTAEAIRQYGVTKGCGMGWKRIRACNQPDAICKCIDPVLARSENVKTRTR